VEQQGDEEQDGSQDPDHPVDGGGLVRVVPGQNEIGELPRDKPEDDKDGPVDADRNPSDPA
jgi:hypothetical protein